MNAPLPHKTHVTLTPSVLAAIERVKRLKSTHATPVIPESNTGTDRFGDTIVYNTRQQEAIELIASGQSCVIIGAAGTGKTTIQKGATLRLLREGKLPPLEISHKFLRSGKPGVVICAYTRRATNNIRKNLPPDLQSNCLTIHKLLEYHPDEMYIVDSEGREKKSMRFVPGRSAQNPLPHSIKTIIVEESSMVAVSLFKQLKDSTQPGTQFIFLGDIQQLPPVFGSAILGYKMLELPVVELTEVYRQALESPIIALAHRILSGNSIPVSEFKSLSVHGLTILPWKKRISAEGATQTLAKFFIKQLEMHKYNPETDAILIPFNKSCGSIELNKHIATQIAINNGRPVFEIIHGWKKSYYSVGDKCLYDREDAVVESIRINPNYVGVSPQSESLTLNYWGIDSQVTFKGMEDFLASVSLEDSDGETKTRAASHLVTLRLLDSEESITISTAGELDALDLGYAITIHKAQGSEWDKVFLCIHQSHAVMTQRELLYTAVTRAKKELYVVCEPNTFEKGIVNQRIKGSTWKEKAAYFKGKVDNAEEQS